MAILNAYSKVPGEETIIEIKRSLLKRGARSFREDYDAAGNLTGMSFLLPTPLGERAFALPSRVDAVLKVLQKDPKVRPSHATLAQARRTAWRNVKDWIEAQLALVDCQQAELAEIFTPYLLTGRQTLYEALKSQALALPAANREAGR